MNCPSRVDADLENDGHNQNPPDLAADLTTNNDLNHIANSRSRRDHRLDELDDSCADRTPDSTDDVDGIGAGVDVRRDDEKGEGSRASKEEGHSRVNELGRDTSLPGTPPGAGGGRRQRLSNLSMTQVRKTGAVLKKFAKFIGPGFMVSVAYIDPGTISHRSSSYDFESLLLMYRTGNYATDVAAGASFRYKLLFVILMSNIFAIFLQSLCVKLGTVTGMNLAENCKANLPPWLNYVLYFFAEAAIIATDIAEVCTCPPSDTIRLTLFKVIGTAIALNLLLHIPLVAGCALSIVDVLVILIFYRPTGSMRGLRIFEVFVMLLVLGVVICFSFQLSLIKNTSAGEVFKGYLPSSALVKSKGLYQSCGILGATVMPHSLYLGSGVVQSRLREFDLANNNTISTNLAPVSDADSTLSSSSLPKYRPSLSAIRHCLTYSVVELGLSLFTFALFVNSAILITAGAALYNNASAASADLFGIHDLLSASLAPAAGTIFALALLLSGTSAGIVCTIAGQMVSEGQLRWTVAPWARRLITRSISITPSIIIAGAVGRDGLSTALEASQVCLSVILPFVSAPLIYFTCRNRFMTVVAERVDSSAREQEERPEETVVEEEATTVVEGVKMRNSWPVATAAGVIWGIIVVMNVALLVLVGIGAE